MSKPLLTLCIPTNGVLHWVRPVLESIFQQDVDSSLYEVVVTDNGDNTDFKEFMRGYADKHPNVIYRETQAQGFLNQQEAFRLAKGEFVKFVNHRMPLRDGALKYLVSFVQQHCDDSEKPVIYFSNGILRLYQSLTLRNFNDFVASLGIYVSWSAGLAFWRDDFGQIPNNQQFNSLFPHTNILFFHRHRKTYIVDDKVLQDSLPVGNTPKGKYDLYWAFAVELPALMLDLVRDRDVTLPVFLKFKRKLLWFLVEQYLFFNVLRRPCSYTLSSYDDAIRVYYSKWANFIRVPLLFLRKSAGKVYHLLKSKM